MKKLWNLHLTSMVSMSLVLFLIGLVSLLLFTARDLGNYVRENMNLTIVLDTDAKTTHEQRIEKFLVQSTMAKSVKYISKEEALKEHIANIGDNPQEFLGFNPLLASVEVKLNATYANPDSVKMIESKLHNFEHVSQIYYPKDMMGMVNENVNKVSIILISLAAVLLLISIALINNTIRLALYADRFKINTMKLVGATPGFIRRPYLLSNMLHGVIAACIALLMLLGVVFFVYSEFAFPGDMLQPLTAISVVLIVLVAGAAITFVSSYVAVGRFLKLKTDDLYTV